MDVSKLEPAERNFKRESLTLIIILVIAFTAGAVILFNYLKMTQRQNKENAQGRPAEIAELTKNYSFKDANDEKRSFFDLTGKVTIAACFSINQLQDNVQVLDILKEFAKEYQDEPRVQFLLLSMDSAEDIPAEKIQIALNKEGISSNQWLIARANGDQFLGYLKKQLKFIHLSKIKQEEKWIIPQRIRIITPDLKIAGKEQDFDIRKVLLDEKQAKEELSKNPTHEFLVHPDFMGDVSKIDLVSHTKKVMKNNINWLLKEKAFDKEQINADKKRNIYTNYLWLFSAFILFIIILGLKVKRKKTVS